MTADREDQIHVHGNVEKLATIGTVVGSVQVHKVGFWCRICGKQYDSRVYFDEEFQACLDCVRPELGPALQGFLRGYHPWSEEAIRECIEQALLTSDLSAWGERQSPLQGILKITPKSRRVSKPSHISEFTDLRFCQFVQLEFRLRAQGETHFETSVEGEPPKRIVVGAPPAFGSTDFTTPSATRYLRGSRHNYRVCGICGGRGRVADRICSQCAGLGQSSVKVYDVTIFSIWHRDVVFASFVGTGDSWVERAVDPLPPRMEGAVILESVANRSPFGSLPLRVREVAGFQARNSDLSKLLLERLLDTQHDLSESLRENPETGGDSKTAIGTVLARVAMVFAPEVGIQSRISQVGYTRWQVYVQVSPVCEVTYRRQAQIQQGFFKKRVSSTNLKGTFRLIGLHYEHLVQPEMEEQISEEGA